MYVYINKEQSNVDEGLAEIGSNTNKQKKGSNRECENFRAKVLTSHTSKQFIRLIKC